MTNVYFPLGTAQPDWFIHAPCNLADPEMFYPDKGESNEPAKAICRSCPFIDECLDHAMATEEFHGIWGGLSTRERQLVRTQNMGPEEYAEHVEECRKEKPHGGWRTHTEYCGEGEWGERESIDPAIWAKKVTDACHDLGLPPVVYQNTLAHARARHRAMAELRDLGWSYGRIGDAAGVTKGAVMRGVRNLRENEEGAA